MYLESFKNSLILNVTVSSVTIKIKSDENIKHLNMHKVFTQLPKFVPIFYQINKC